MPSTVLLIIVAQGAVWRLAVSSVRTPDQNQNENSNVRKVAGRSPGRGSVSWLGGGA